MSIVRSRRGFQGFSIEVKSEGGHSGIILKKDKRKNSILKMAEIILKLEELANYEKSTTLNTGVITGGTTYNTLAPYCKILCDSRFKTNEERERIIQSVKEIIKETNVKNDFDITFNTELHFPAMKRDSKTDEFSKLCFKIASELNINLIEEDRGGGSEASILQYSNPDAFVLDGFGPRGDNEHTLNEFVYIDSIFISIEFSLNIILEIQNGKIT